MKIVSDDGVKARIKVTEKEVQQMINKYEGWIKQLTDAIDDALDLTNKLSTAAVNKTDEEFDELIYELSYVLESGKELL